MRGEGLAARLEGRILPPVKLLLAPAARGLDAARHLLWYLSYHVWGETRERG